MSIEYLRAKKMLKFKIVRKDGYVLLNNLLPSEVYKLIKNGKIADPFKNQL